MSFFSVIVAYVGFYRVGTLFIQVCMCTLIKAWCFSSSVKSSCCPHIDEAAYPCPLPNFIFFFNYPEYFLQHMLRIHNEFNALFLPFSLTFNQLNVLFKWLFFLREFTDETALLILKESLGCFRHLGAAGKFSLVECPSDLTLKHKCS